MLEGLSSAAAGMAAQQAKLDAISNDLANANTTGYKHVRVGFRDLLYQQAGGPAANGVRVGAGAASGDAARGEGRPWGRRRDFARPGPLLGDGRAAEHRQPARRRDPGRWLPARPPAG